MNYKTTKDLTQAEIDAITRILRDHKIKDYEAEFAMSSADFMRQWEADAPELIARLGASARRDVAFEVNHWARLLQRDAPPPLVAEEPEIDEWDTRPVDTSGNE